jgi:xylan 1,4-beta-xylosidase
MTTLPNPLLPGFHPDPSVVQVGADYYLATSTFEYLPGIPIHHSRDLLNWELIGHVVTRPGQFQMRGVPTSGGCWAPTIRWHDGRFYVIVADAMGRGMLLFTAADPAGPWDDGKPLEGIDGIDPDLAWDENGSCYVTYSALVLDGPPDAQNHHGIMQVRFDIANGRPLEPMRPVWSGTGLMFPEAPHLYKIGNWWYLLIAEGGTERGHTVSIARSASPDGPFEGYPANPILSARSTDRPVQNTGHGDLVQAPDGSWHMVLLGVRTRGTTRAFSALGRETFGTSVLWADEWPVVAPVQLTAGLEPPVFTDTFTEGVLGHDWIGVRRLPTEVSLCTPGKLRLVGEQRTMDHPEPTFVGRRQSRLDAYISVAVGSCSGVGGLSVRYDEEHHFDIEIDGDQIVARALVPTISTTHAASFVGGPVTLFAMMVPPPTHVGAAMTCDLIHLGFETPDGSRTVVGAFDGRSLSAEVACSFTGRVAGVYCVSGELSVLSYSEVGIQL